MSESPEKKNKKYLKKCRICGLRTVDGVIIHKMPRNDLFREKWIKATNNVLTCSSVVCSNHFKIGDYLCCDGKKKLKSGSVPSLNLDVEYMKKTRKKTSLKTSQRLSSCETSNLSDKQNVDSDSEDFSSSHTNENTSSEEEICYVYYLDEKQNVRYYQTSTS